MTIAQNPTIRQQISERFAQERSLAVKTNEGFASWMAANVRSLEMTARLARIRPVDLHSSRPFAGR